MFIKEKFDVRINIPHEKEWKQWSLFVLLTLAYTFILIGIPDYIQDVGLYKIAIRVLDIIKILPALWYIRKLGLKRKDFFKGKNIGFQVLTGLGSAVLISVLVSLPEIMKNNTYVVFEKYSTLGMILFNTYSYVLVAGLFEELSFRYAMQEGLERLLGKMKVLSPLIVALIFGLWHYPVLQDWSQVLLCGCIGLIWGYGKYFFEWNLLGLVISHGLYDIFTVYFPVWFSKL